MKTLLMKHLLITGFLFLAANSYAQTDSTYVILQSGKINPQEIDSTPEEPAAFPGGKAALQSYLAEQLVYPPEAAKNEIEGLCYVKFIVDENGKTLNPVILRGVIDCAECNTEAVRLVAAMPAWEPAKNAGTAVKSYYILKITFKLP